jgi:hypothetical protein
MSRYFHKLTIDIKLTSTGFPVEDIYSTEINTSVQNKDFHKSLIESRLSVKEVIGFFVV